MCISCNEEFHRNKHFLSQETDIMFNIFDQIKGTVVNQTLPHLHGESFEATLRVPLKQEE